MEQVVQQEQKCFRVQANLDQLKRAGLDTKYQWKPSTHGNRPDNRVEAHFSSKEEATEAYNTLHFKKLVCFRNWID